MEKSSAAAKKKLLKDLNAQLQELQKKLAVANKAVGVDEYIDVKIKESQARFQLIKAKDKEDKAVGNFFIKLEILAEKQEVYVPLSISSGKKTSGFMYQIEGTAEGSISTTDIKIRGEGVTQVTLGTLLFAKIPVGKTAELRIQVEINGKLGKNYKIIISRINYKLKLTDTRYNQYLKPLVSDSVKFS